LFNHRKRYQTDEEVSFMRWDDVNARVKEVDYGVLEF
jgi:hypothetical protein